MYDDNSAEEMVFPCLFPNGVNGLHTVRDPPLSFTDYFQSRLLNADNHWSSNIPYLLWSASLLEKMRLRDSVSIAMRIRSSSLGSTGRITAGELLTWLKLKLKKLGLKRRHSASNYSVVKVLIKKNLKTSEKVKGYRAV